jgi:alcohol oxidase
MYTRASASDYDDFQAKGWTTKELIPLMKKHETYQVILGYLQATINAYRL